MLNKKENQDKINLIIKYLEKRTDNQVSQSILKKILTSKYDGEKNYIIQKMIHPNIRKKIFEGEL